MSSLTTTDPIRLVQITDTHLYGRPSGTLLRMDTQDSFERVLALVQEKEEQIDFILATGDIAQDSSVGAYRYFMEKIIALNAPFRWIPGNHDTPEVMLEVAETTEANGKSVRINNWLLLFLDSSVAGQVHGKLANKELQFLSSQLDAAERSDEIDHCLVCLHHNPTRGNAVWMKDIGLQNGDSFFAIITQYEKCRCVVYGHIHQQLDYRHMGVRCLCTPSTCIQFKPNVTNFELDKVNPGYRSLKLFANGDIETQGHRIEGYESNADFESTGY